MPSSRKLHIDSEGVKRGYYVYLHKDCATGEVFYVGKGHGRRAWESDGRNSDWRKRVASQSHGWEVKIVRDDLSEIESFELEATLVDKYGGPCTSGGKLANWVPGGEDSASVGISVQLDDGGWSTAYYEAREFKDLPRREKEAIATSVPDELDPFVNKLSELEEEGLENDNDDLFDSASMVGSVIYGLLESAANFANRRISWKDFGIALEEGLDDLQSASDDAQEVDAMVRPLLRQVLMLVGRLFATVDSGNRKIAEQIADRATQKP